MILFEYILKISLNNIFKPTSLYCKKIVIKIVIKYKSSKESFFKENFLSVFTKILTTSQLL